MHFQTAHDKYKVIPAINKYHIRNRGHTRQTWHEETKRSYPTGKKWEELRASWIDSCRRQEGRASPLHPEGKGGHVPGAGGSRCLPGHPRRVPSPVGAGHRPRERCGAVPGAAPSNRAPDSTKISTSPVRPWADTALLTPRWAPFIPPSTSPGTAPASLGAAPCPATLEGGFSRA